VSEFFHVDGVNLHFGGVVAVDDLSFALERGEYLGIIGPNGAGKTTLLNCVSGVLRPTSGSIRLDSQSLIGKRPHKVARLGIARTFQAVEHYKELTVTEYVLLGRLRHLAPSVWKRGIALRSAVRAERRERMAAEGYAERYGLSEYRGTTLGELPYGFQKLADIVRAIAMQPRLLLLDEPASGSSEQERHALRATIEELRAEECSVVLVDHDVEFVSTTCDRMMAMAMGRKLCSGSPADVLADPQVIEQYLGTTVAP
jgi:branched-chain amino acid transport system ATP-binding protein